MQKTSRSSKDKCSSEVSARLKLPSVASDDKHNLFPARKSSALNYHGRPNTVGMVVNALRLLSKEGKRGKVSTI